MNAFKILGIEPTQDTKAIKKAYAALVKKYHPEEDIQKWQEIHKAYQSALSWAKGQSRKTVVISEIPVPTDSVQAPEQVEEAAEAVETAEEAEAAELNELFDSLEELSAESKAEKLEQERKVLERAVGELEQIGRRWKLRYESFKELFFKDEYQQVIWQDDFLSSWSKILERRAIDKKLYQLMKEQLERIILYRKSNGTAAKKIALIELTRFTSIRIEAAYDRYKTKRKQARAIAIFGTLILLELSSFAIYKVKEWREGKSKQAQETQVLPEVPYIPSDEVKKQWFSEINLENMTESDLLLAEANLNELAKFLMRADEEILSYVLPYTQTLEPGVLVLGGEFEIKKALQGQGSAEEIIDSGDSYEMVHLSLPFTNQIWVGEKRIELPKKTASFAVRTDGDADSVLLWIDTKEMGFEEGCEIYCFDGEDYQKVGEIWSKAEIWAERRWYDVLTYRVFWIHVSRLEEKEFPVILIPAGNESGGMLKTS
ncbi:MAG: DnaJ domain-containing protein [Lachnospiraceae bacterium]|nr:DnaJ domain-containing protein [Lachnospiraceae bacterium]